MTYWFIYCNWWSTYDGPWKVYFKGQGGTYSGNENWTTTYYKTQINNGACLPVPTKSGYSFRGWFTGTNGDGNIVYTGGSGCTQYTMQVDTEVTNLISSSQTSFTVYAFWESTGSGFAN